MTAVTRVMSDETSRVERVPSLYEAQRGRLAWLGGRDGWNFQEYSIRDVIGLPRQRWSQAWFMAESPIEAFEVAKDLLADVAMYSINLMVREMEGSGLWYCCVEAREKA